MLDTEAMELCNLLPKGSAIRDAAHSTRLEGKSIIHFLRLYIEELTADDKEDMLNL